MERLTSSPFAMTIYGNCGGSQIIEIGESSFHDYIKLARQHGDKTSPKDKVRIGFQLASGIADMHSIDGTDRPSLAHNDIDPGQIILVDNVFKIRYVQSQGKPFSCFSILHKLICCLFPCIISSPFHDCIQ